MIHEYMTCCSFSYAFIHFTDEKACKDTHATMQNQVISGRVLTVMYAKKSSPESKDSKKTKQSRGLPWAMICEVINGMTNSDISFH